MWLSKGEVKRLQRKIIHCDCDSFYASVEMRDNPELRDKPLAVGGTNGRGVVATCNYLAREYGVHSAMPMAQANKLCPDLVAVRPDIDKYKQVSRQIQAIFSDYTDLIEPLSLDEAFLDVSDVDILQGSATLIAQQIRARVEAEVGITISAGVANSKFLAKVASDWHKPNGLTVVAPDQVASFVAELDVAKIFGVGKVTQQRLYEMGVVSCQQLQDFTVYQLTERFGKFGRRLYELCRGIDERPVKTQRQRKSISIEHTYDNNLVGVEQCLAELPSLLESLQQRIDRNKSRHLIVKQFVKFKFEDFSRTTAESVATELDIHQLQQLFRKAAQRSAKSVRLLGIGVRLRERNLYQYDLFE
ncbi:DNA polymerase IV [Sinobacterium norvegicum]|uniref:DNA polymerase IV n=1 Tax=Sinobacterium norvegicum TaxID=1641715 RepID=A0ABM9AHR2_9GAMM|nr:DNA polymerase IV [Sinobacterium norvegicum]CAH0992577.1 DNA polymerase IV [Sinobacterium norvegicum]